MKWGLIDPALYLPRQQCDEFHVFVRAGDVEGMLSLLEVEPELVHARNGNRETSLMVAAVHPDTGRSIQMMELLVEREAYLGSHDCCRRHALLLACKRNVDRAVIVKLLEWNTHLGGTKFMWHDHDTKGRSALVLASKNGNTPVTSLLLDNIDIARYAKHNHPFRVLKLAIDSGNHQHALDVALHEKIRSSIEDPEITHYKGSGAPESRYTISTCTVAAIDHGMLDLVQVLYMLNRQKVSRAVWYKVHELYCEGLEILAAIPTVLLKIGRQFTDIWRWKQVREVCLMRYGCKEDDPRHLTHPLVRLPDDVFHRVIAFAVPPAFQHPSDFELDWCRCLIVSAIGVCRWHNCYKATRSDYDRAFNRNC